jgi:hypothetical protein
MPESSKNRVYYFSSIFLAECKDFSSENLSECHPLVSDCNEQAVRATTNANASVEAIFGIAHQASYFA